MKKNLFWSMLAMSGMLFATSCSQDELVNESAGDFVSATFNIGTADGIGSRAIIGDGTKADKVVCAVFDEKGEEMDDLRQTLSISDKKAKYSIRLAKGQDYRVAFFAYNEAAAAYDVTDMKNIVVKPDQKSNVEDRDAFTAYVDVAATVNAIEKEVTLKRPFAQLNLGVDATEWADAVKAGVTVFKSYIKVSNVYNAFSAYDNAVVATAQEMEMVFNMNQIPTEKLKVDLDRDNVIEDGEEFQYLALNYLLVGNNDAEKSLTDVEFVWETEDGKTNNPTSSFINIPVQRNYRTNIIGKLLTSPADFNIVIDEKFYNSTKDDYIVEEGGNNGEVTTVTTTVATVGELQAAIDNAIVGDNIIKFEQNIDANSARSTAATLTITQHPGVNILIDGCGNQFDGTFRLGADGNGGVNVTGTLTFKNINFVHADGAIDYIWADDASTHGFRYAHDVTVENCTFTGNNNGNVVGLRYRQTFNMAVKNCTFTGMHSLMQATGASGITLDNVTIENSKSGVSFGTSTNLVVKNSEFNVREYGIRADGSGAYNLTVENTEINAAKPIIIRQTTGAYSVALEGTNALTTSEQYHVVFTNGKDDEAYVAPTGTYTITGAEGYNVFPSAADQPMIASNLAQLNALLANASVTKIVLGADIKEHIVMKSNKTIDGDGYFLGSINLNGADNVTLKNIKFDAANAVYGYDGSGNKKDYAFSNIITGDAVNKPMKGSHNLVIDGCTFTGTFANRGAAISFTDQNRKSGGSGNITIKNCMFDNTNSNYVIYSHYTGDSLNGHGNFVIENNTFKTTCYAGPIYLGRYASNVPVVVTGNNFQSVASIDDAIFVQDHGSYGVSVNASNNTFNN